MEAIVQPDIKEWDVTLYTKGTNEIYVGELKDRVSLNLPENITLIANKDGASFAPIDFNINEFVKNMKIIITIFKFRKDEYV